jgi:hypothetical protein
MNPSEPDSGLPASRARFAASSNTRRTFIKRAIGGLAIAVPAFRILSSATPAAAAETPGPDSCTGVCNPNTLIGVFCGSDLFSTSCKGPDVSRCYEEWERPNGSTYTVQSGWCSE